MALDHRMSAIQNNLKEKKAYIDARPQRIAKWVGKLSHLYGTLDIALADEVAQGLCVVSRTVVHAKSDDLGPYDEPSISIKVEGVSYVTSSARHATSMNPDIVDLQGTTDKWFARLSFIKNSSGTYNWAVTAHEHAAYLDKMNSAWLTPESFKRAIEPFFPFPSD